MKFWSISLMLFCVSVDASILSPQYINEDYRDRNGVQGVSNCATFTNFEAQSSFSPKYSAKFCRIMLDNDPNYYCIIRATDTSRYYLPRHAQVPAAEAFIAFDNKIPKHKIDLFQVYCSGYGDNCVIASQLFNCTNLIEGRNVSFTFSKDVYLASKDNMGNKFQLQFPQNQ